VETSWTLDPDEGSSLPAESQRDEIWFLGFFHAEEAKPGFALHASLSVIRLVSLKHKTNKSLINSHNLFHF